MYKETFISNSPKETEEIASEFAKKLKNNDFIAMYGDLGAGKTSFTRGLCSYLVPGEYVSSPTYTIVNEYQGEDNWVCHFDMYRISSEDDLYSIGFYDYTDCIIICEWCENIEYSLPDSYYRVTVNKTDSEEKRMITIEEVVK
ncbi:MAG: tRNA (adenosine(37)-N6)-threonylcarbamoyltransferase complex ATPase subunit type 1 TsaE [Ruminococcaceae bacterium]|nr:tRNA (adenosine(37)-N6)-threonylcarbamoyltransferase complex ATPase subunit type 1 TsaE [Oscillospiraceae bacterium]